MKLSGNFMLSASVDEVWELLMDAEKLASCMPGVDSIEMHSPTQYDAVMAVKMPFMTIKFHAQGQLKEAEEKNYLLVELTGKPVGLAGSFRNQVTIRLEEKMPNETLLNYL